MRHCSRIRFASGVLALSVATAIAASPPEPRPLDLVEKLDVRIVQVDVSVTDPKSSSYGSVAGLTADQFDIRLDGTRLSPEERARMAFDAVCSRSDTLARPVIVVVDFNYVDARGRALVANALDDLAAAAKDRPELYKFYGLTRQVRMLGDGFTRDPAVIRGIASLVRATVHKGDQSPKDRTPGEAGPDPLVDRVVKIDSGDGGFSGLLPKIVSFQLETRDEYRREPGGYEAEDSLKRIESIMRSHARYPGRKEIVVFSSEAFGTTRPLTEMVAALQPVRQLAQQGFAVWTVDVGGVAGSAKAAQSYMSALARDTGGATLRNTNGLADVFRRVDEQLSCYYLFSLPIPAGQEGTVHRSLTVALDTVKYPSLWGLTVTAPPSVTVVDPKERLMNQRLAALLAPDDYVQPAVSAVLGFPVPADGKDVIPVRLRVPLRDLTWTPQPDGGVSTHVLLDAVVEHDTAAGTESVCNVDATRLALKLPSVPGESDPAGLTVEIPCPAKKDGLHTARGALTDLDGGTVGGARSTVMFRRGGSHAWDAMGLRVEAASGTDFVWRPGETRAHRDRERATSRLVTANDPAATGDRLVFEYVLCGPDRARANEAIAHVLLAGDDGARTLGGGLLELRTSQASGPFCSVARVTLPDYSLEPGHYVFSVRDRTGAKELVSAAFTVK